MKYQWINSPEVSGENIAFLTSAYPIHPAIAKILYNRGFRSKQHISAFFFPKLSELHNPFLFDHMEKAVDRIIKAMRGGENILIYGDYDVDGVTSVCILYDGLFNLGGKVSFFIPNRFNDGYGISIKTIKKAKERGVSLIITVDCGITAVDEIAYAKEVGIDVIVSDHHIPAESIPDAAAILNAKIQGSQYPFSELAGCGVAFKLLQGISQKLGIDKQFCNQYLDLAAIGTAADIVPLAGENRILVKYGLEMINISPRAGIFALLENCGYIGKALTVNAIVFVLAPRLNAVGRISNAKKAVHLLTAKSLQQGRNISKILEKENTTRKSIDEQTFLDAQLSVEQTINLDHTRILVIAKENWHFGVVGIVASRLMEKYNRPVVLISIQNGMGKGSARSTSNFDIYEAFTELEDYLETFGGHRFAAGITIKPDKIDEFRAAINAYAKHKIQPEDTAPKLNIDAEVRLGEFTGRFFSDLKQMAPFGPSNMRPVFCSKNLHIYGNVSVVGNNHLKLKFKQDDVVIDAIGYNLGHCSHQITKQHRQVNCAYILEESNWNGQTTMQMKIKDIEVM
jgi:single-stranded-DNA-specific exonuclease